MSKKKIPFPVITSNAIKTPQIPEDPKGIRVDFRYFHISPIRVNGVFNNHFKNTEAENSNLCSFLGTVLPKICSEDSIEQLLKSQRNTMHFHIVREKPLEKVTTVLKEYRFPVDFIEQISDSIYEFKASMKDGNAARIVAYRVGNTLYPLFFDSNHHIYFNDSKSGNSLFYAYCPRALEDNCSYIIKDCFARDYLDEEKIKKSYNL